jgi:ATP-dependent RNA helicase A
MFIFKNDTTVDTEATISLISNQVIAEFSESKCLRSVGVIPWSPPQPNWNPWLAINIDEGPLATVSF